MFSRNSKNMWCRILMAFTLLIVFAFSACAENRAPAEGLPIIFENGLHYVVDPDYPDERIILYCMNNKRAWPHSTGEHPHVPNYEEGYLTPEHFESQAAYEECMQKLRKLLFSGYPYNGERLYKIVAEGELHVPTEREFNNMLIVPPQLQPDFPYLAHHDFSMEDLNNQKHFDELVSFVNSVAWMFPDKETDTGISYTDIISMPFYKAAFCMTYLGFGAAKKDVQEVFANMYSASYFVTETQAYDATQFAVWRLLNEYHIEDNDINSLENNELAKVLWQYSQHGALLDRKPLAREIAIRGDLNFTYDPKDKKWHSGKLRVEEPVEYNGLYLLDLPEGVTAICENLTYVYGNEEYELVSDEQPEMGDRFRVMANIDWLQDMRQYSPIGNEEFQHMIGAVIRRTPISRTIFYNSQRTGALEITKKVIGDKNDMFRDFSFTLELSDKTINGRYDDLEFKDGVSHFTLKNNETLAAGPLPAGVKYKVTENDNADYAASGIHLEGKIGNKVIIEAEVDNLRLHNLLISKAVEGDKADKNKKFTFIVEIKQADGTPLEGEYQYVGSVKAGCEGESEAPQDGTLNFKNGKATIKLSHGQQVTIQGIPFKSTYIVTEKEANQDDYVTTYNQSGTPATGKLDKDAEVHVLNGKFEKPGALKISKTAVGGSEDMQKEFSFTLTLSDKKVSGVYGDLEFTNGAAQFTLKHGETKTAVGLPANTQYTVTENNADGYFVEASGETGVIMGEHTLDVEFKNTKLYDLLIGKKVEGEKGDKKKRFTFDIQLTQPDGMPLNGTYQYVGSVRPGFEQESRPPKDGMITFTDGKAEIKLSHAQRIQIKGLPYGTTYYVTEREANQDGYVTNYEQGSASGKLDAPAEVHIVNSNFAGTGALMISKLTVGNQDDQQKEFTFVAELSDKSVNGLYGDLEFHNGTAQFTLKHGEVKVAMGLPENVKYKVSEKTQEGYLAENMNAEGVIQDKQTINVLFTNTKLHDLVVSKTVEGETGDKKKPFTFIIQLTHADGTPLAGSYRYSGSVKPGYEQESQPPQDGTLTFVDGKAEIKLSHGQQARIQGIPFGTIYKVVEKEANQDGYVTTYEPGSASGKLDGLATVHVVNNNTKSTGALRISKTTIGTNDDLHKTFSFKLELPGTGINGRYGDFEFHNGTAQFTLKHGETKTAANLPADASYQVTEMDHEGYSVERFQTKGTIKGGQSVEAAFRNTRLLDLLISKTVEGLPSDLTRPFTFIIELTKADGTPLEGTYHYSGSVKAGCEQEVSAPADGTLIFNGGKAQVKLSHGQQVKIEGIPFGTSYVVEEKEANQDGFTTVYNGSAASGKLDGQAEIHVLNTKQAVPGTDPEDFGKLPQTGDTSNIFAWLALGAASLVGIGALAHAERKKKH